MNNINPSSLQTFNNELVKGLETLREKRSLVNLELNRQQEQEKELVDQMAILSNQLKTLQKSIEMNQKLKCDYERLIEDTEIAYYKIVESSQTLLEVLQRESGSLKVSKNR